MRIGEQMIDPEILNEEYGLALSPRHWDAGHRKAYRDPLSSTTRAFYSLLSYAKRRAAKRTIEKQAREKIPMKDIRANITLPKRAKDAERQAILKDASTIISGARQEAYGAPDKAFATIAAFWNTYIEEAAKKRPTDCPLVLPHDVAVMLDLLKTARVISNPEKRDNWVDKAGYAGCGYEVAVAHQGERAMLGKLPRWSQEDAVEPGRHKDDEVDFSMFLVNNTTPAPEPDCKGCPPDDCAGECAQAVADMEALEEAALEEAGENTA